MKTVAALSLFTLVGCSSSPGAAEPVGVAMRAVAARSTPQGTPQTLDLVGSLVEVGSAVANVERIDFSLPDGVRCADLDPTTLGEGVRCDDLDTLRIGEPRRFDLVTGIADPPLDAAVVPALPYRRVEVRFAEADSDPVLGEDTIAADLTVDGAPVSMRLRFSEDARFESSDGIPVEDGAQALLLLDADAWFAGVDLAACGEAGGIVDEDADGACDLEGEVRDAIEASAELSSS